jgi:hypothetical protein
MPMQLENMTGFVKGKPSYDSATAKQYCPFHLPWCATSEYTVAANHLHFRA